MCTFIGIESLAANALIELLDRGHTREISFDKLVDYGMAVVRVLQLTTGEEAVLLLSRKYQMNLIENYSDFFDVEMDSTGTGSIRLRDKVTLNDLRNYFRWTMSAPLIEAFSSPDALQKLGVAA